MQTRDEVLEQIQAALVELFEIERGRITPEARLNEDLELDSIDAVDLLDRPESVPLPIPHRSRNRVPTLRRV